MQTADGSQLYTTYCIACHGKDGKLGMGGAIDLTRSDLCPTEIEKIVHDGLRNMPSFHHILTQKEIEAVSLFVMKLQR